MNIHLTPEEIAVISGLVGLSVPPRALPALMKSITDIMAYVEEIKGLDVTGVPETARLTDEVNIWREDIVEESLSREAVFKNGTSRDGCFVVPRVLPNDHAY